MLEQISLESKGPQGVSKRFSVRKAADGSWETEGSVPEQILKHLECTAGAERIASQERIEFGKKEEDWQRRSDTDDVFASDGGAILTRQRSARLKSDGTFEVDESVPAEVQEVLKQIEADKKAETHLRA